MMKTNFARLAVLLSSIAVFAQAPQGIPRELARQRAQQLEDIRYKLSYTIVPKASSFTGHEELRFVQNPDDRGVLPEWLDFRGGTINSLTVNGRPAPTTLQNGHLELPAKLLKLDENVVSIDFTAPVAPAGKAITRFEDKDDGSEYIYTLFVPMDAEMAFPCFDQPDLKAKFQLTLDAPPTWTVISNSPIVSSAGVVDGLAFKHTEFAETRPISTYLFAFAAGPFEKVHDTPGLPGLYVRKSKLKRAEEEAPEVQQITAEGIKSLSAYFDHPFPFPKYDLILIPGFAYGGMEHAGATFLREESVLFRTAPTHSDHLNRDILLLHETTHQWFGDLVTMRWFDDLWLKEGFAQYMAYHTLAELMPQENIWKRFYQAIKPAAYAIDVTRGTTPIYQDIANLQDAKSAYGAIVYSKAPGVLKQLNFVLGKQNFRDGLRLYLKEHAYGNAEWSDLVRAFERVSGKSLDKWAQLWIRTAGMPRVTVDWSCDSRSRISTFILKQQQINGASQDWPIATQVVLSYSGGHQTRLRAQLDSGQADLPDVIGQPCPQFIFANDQDHAYGLFLLDERSQKAVIDHLGTISDPFERTLLWGALWDSVRDAGLDPHRYIDLAMRLAPKEQDESLVQSLVGHAGTALHRYINAQDRARLIPHAETIAADRMLHSGSKDLRIIWFRAFRGLAETSPARTRLKELLAGKLSVPGVELRPLDRWNMVTALVAMHDPGADNILAAERKRDPSGDGQKYAYVAGAAEPDPKAKQHYFDEYLHNAARPEDWIEQSLGAFNAWNQSDLTLPYLKPALEALPQMKRERKIFFVLGWLNAFIDGQQSSEAQVQAHEFLRSGSLDHDLKLKLLEVSDELDRAVRIKHKLYGTPYQAPDAFR